MSTQVGSTPSPDRSVPPSVSLPGGRGTTLAAQVSQPEPALPASRRAFPRIPCRVLADFVIDGCAYRDRIANISEGGAFIETSSPMEAGRPITLTFSLFQDQQPLKIVGEVVWSSATGIGVRFPQNQAIAEFCSQKEDSFTYPLQSAETPAQTPPPRWGRRATDLGPSRRSLDPHATLPVWVALCLVVALSLVSRYETNTKLQAMAERVDWAAQSLVRIQSMVSYHPGPAADAAPVQAAMRPAAPVSTPTQAAQPASLEQPPPQADLQPAATLPPSTVVAQPNAAAPQAPLSETTYVVQTGDNLFRIGLRFNVPPSVLREYNGLASTDRILVGMKLKIPVEGVR